MSGRSGNSGPPRIFVHPSATVDDGALLGEGTRVWHYSHVMPGAELGEGCNLGQNVFVAPRVRLGRNVKIQNNVSLYEGVVCEDDVFLGPSCVFTNVGTPRSAVNRRGQYATTHLERGVSVGANATIVCGTRLGRYAFVAAGAVVTHDVPPHALVMGVPARVRAWACRCGATLQTHVRTAWCDACGASYTLDWDGRVEPDSYTPGPAS